MTTEVGQNYTVSYLETKLYVQGTHIFKNKKGVEK